MAGASEQTERVAYVSGNWSAGRDGTAGAFELQFVTEDERRHSVRVAPQDVAAVLAMTRASDVLLWDPNADTLIAPNLAGEWMQLTWSAGDARCAGRPH